ncbi:hypothetical protein IC235_17665 [Hymenobacter sp. BT664]|uniref:SH3 domain-containing protein n=1 Tax=Hymenobacter montanus TaxID=2771359 RepID=A0A927GL19_9BACT|nr:SH3 domain-containing protein [Hymenobacter montanus]MBD2769721.1 hypothetical protein [Hymenobacter montanus]
MKTAFTTALVAFLGVSAQAQTHSMWVNAPSVNLRDKPAATSHVMLKLGAPAEVTVLGKPNGQWSQAMFSPYDGGMSWAGWVETRYLVASRDSVKVPPAAALFTVPKDEKVYPKRSGVTGVPPAARNYNGNVHYR